MRKGLLRIRIQRYVAGLFVIILLVVLSAPAVAAEKKPRVLKVAFPQVEGLTMTAEDGSRHGLVVDYLNEIAKYTGWEYEYVDTDGNTMLDKFMAGEFDLMGGNYYMPGFEEYYAYPKYNTGYSKSVLLARKDDNSVWSYNLESMNGKTIGVYKRAIENIRRLKEFLSINNLDCTIKEYGPESLSKDGDLYAFLRKGEVDMLLGNGFENSEELRTVASFDSQPYYIVTNVGNQEVLDGLNMALGKILDSNPDFATECYAKNFPDRGVIDIRLNEEERGYIEQKKTIRIAAPRSYSPLFGSDSSRDPQKGVVPDILDEVSSYTGLQFSFLYTDSYIDAVQLVQQGKADILSFFLGSEEDSVRQKLVLSSSYVNMNSIIVRNKTTSYPSKGLTGAVVDGQELPSGIKADKVRTYHTVTDALSAVDNGEADFIYGLASRLERDIQQHHFVNLVPVTLINDKSDLCFALSRPADSNLLSILNKAINSLPDEEKNTILNRNMVSIGDSSFSIMEFIYANPMTFVISVTLFLLILVTVILWYNRMRMKAAMIQNDLEKAEAESRAKGEFLSRMSHEIRTPMNAVVGLADLMAMKKDAPEDIRKNLFKIRSSSHYLLALINDILDMSRIDSGMLSINSEPFSLEQMIEDIRSMLESDASQRGLHYILKKEIIHSSVMGDAIRLRQVLTNLLSNAFKFTPEGGTVRLLVSEAAESKTEAAYTFQVIDNGKGISHEDQQRIFESFEQSGTSSSKSQGTGLGLPISRSIVQMMGGHLEVRSELGHGSEFYFTITLPFGEPVKGSDSGEKHDEKENRLDGLHVLIAEDNDLNAEIVMELLESRGATVYRSANGRQALETFRESRPGDYQVILMDIKMPEMNGLEATKVIRSLPRPDAAVIPIIAMTANTFKEDMDAALAAGMNDFISKPLDVNRLFSLLENIPRNIQKKK